MSYQIVKDGACAVTCNFANYSNNYDPLEKELLEELYTRLVKHLSNHIYLAKLYFIFFYNSSNNC